MDITKITLPNGNTVAAYALSFVGSYDQELYAGIPARPPRLVVVHSGREECINFGTKDEADRARDAIVSQWP